MNRSNENLDKDAVENPPQDEFSQYSGTASDSERDSSGSESGSSSASGSSSQSIEAEWARFIEEDGTLMYLESYVASTVKERQVHQAIKAASEFERKTPFPSPQKNLKRQTKLLNLLKRRPSVRIKSSSASSDPTKAPAGANQEPTSPPPKVTFRDNPSGEVRHVILRVIEIGSNFGRRASFCETVLGILPGRFNEPPDSRVMVAGLAPGSQALKDGSIKIGDWLKELNGVEVNWDNLDTILLDVRIPSTVTLSVQKCAVETLPHDDHHNLKRVTQTRLARFISGKERKSAEWSALVERGALPLHTVLHLSLSGVTEESPDRSDVRYQFPSMNNKLVQVRGMFLTLCHSLQDIVGTPVVSCTVTLHGVHYHTAFCREDNDVLLMSLPHFCISEGEIVALMEQVCKLIKFEFGTLSRGLLNPKNKDYLDHLFLMTLEDVLMLEVGYGVVSTPHGGSVPPFTPIVPPFTDYALSKSRLMFGAPTSLLLRDDFAKSQLEICLNELQSGDFGDNDSDCEDCLLLYNIIGCSIFYKSHLLLSHLDTSTSECVFLFLERHRLLQLVAREAVSQLVLWRRVFPTHHPEGESHPTSLEREVDHYLLVVAMNHFLLATLVESGNVTKLMDQNAGPDPFLVDQTETTLYHLHSLHVHTACEESLAGSMIETEFLDAKGNANIYSKNSKGKTSHGVEGSQARTPDVPSILKQKSPSPFDPCECERIPGEGSDDSPHSHSPCPPKESPTPEGDAEEGDSCRGDETSSDSDWRVPVWKPSDAKTGSPQTYGPFSNPRSQPQAPLRVTVGDDNVLLHLVQLDVGEGVIVIPHTDEAPPLQAQLLRNFYAAVAHIQQILHTGHRNKEPAGNYSGSNCLNSVKEYGIMFECQMPTKSKTQDVTYWVVGRLYGSPYEREIYVALQDSITQNMQEIAFKLALGCS